MSSEMIVGFFVPGLPRPGGSKKGLYNPKLKRVFMKDMSNNADWKAAVREFGERAMNAIPPVPKGWPVQLVVRFYMPRPKAHFKKDGTLKPGAPKYHTSAPDTTKLLRSTEDALKAITWNDDSQVADQQATKYYSNDGRIGAEIVLKHLA